MNFLKNKVIDVWFNDFTFRDLILLEVNDNYLVCADSGGTIRAFNNRFVKEITCREEANTQEEQEITCKEESRTESISENKNEAPDTGEFIPERQSRKFRLDEMRECSSNDEFSISKNMGIEG